MSTVAVSSVIAGPLTQDFLDIFREHYDLVHGTAYGVTGKREDAEDVVQTIFLRLLGRALPVEWMKNPRAYLYRAAVNLSLNTIRARQRHVLTDDVERFEALVAGGVETAPPQDTAPDETPVPGEAPIPAREAHAANFVSELVAKGQALARSVEIGQQIASMPPLAVQAIREAIRLTRPGGVV